MLPRLLAVLLLSVSPLVLTQVAAQQPPKPGARPAPAAAPHIAAPAAAPHFAAPAPHFAAPAPHFSAPAPRMAAPTPHFAAPRAAPHFAAPPRMATPHFAAPSRPGPSHFAAPQRAPHFAAPRHAPSPHFAAPVNRGGRAAHQIAQPVSHAASAAAQAGHLGRAEQRQVRAQEHTQIRQLQAQQRQHLHDLRAHGHLDRNTLRQLRAQDRQQLHDLRAQQHNQRQGLTTQQAQQNQHQHLPRGMTPLSPDAARQGRFAAAFAHRDHDHDRWRAEHSEPWHAWHRHHRVAFVAWAGAVFWPYAYDDVFYYTFWPEAYDDSYWASAYDDFLDSVYWATGNPYSDYAYAGPTAETVGLATGSTGSRSSRRHHDTTVGAAPAAADVCAPGPGLSWPFDQIEKVVQPDPDQQKLLDNLKNAANQASSDFKSSCTSTAALTPTGRLQAIVDRLQATRSALDTVRPALAKFYNSLSDEQKARFNAIGPDVARQVRSAGGEAQPQADACSGQKPGLTDLPIERIADAVQPTDAQQGALDALRQANQKAVGILQAACPDSTPQTPVGRLDAMAKRLDAMIQAAKTVQPALQSFYASLSNEQKAKFNTLDQQARR